MCIMKSVKISDKTHQRLTALIKGARKEEVQPCPTYTSLIEKFICGPPEENTENESTNNK